MTIEKTATPSKSPMAVNTLSVSLLGWKSPKPTVVSDVKAKYSNLVNTKLDSYYLKTHGVCLHLGSSSSVTS